MKVSFDDLKQTISGFSTPLFGVSYNPSEGEREIAKELISFLEKQKALYDPFIKNILTYGEVPVYMVKYLLPASDQLSVFINKANDMEFLNTSITSMLVAFRKFFTTCQSIGVGFNFSLGKGILDQKNSTCDRAASCYTFFVAIGELRGVFGEHIAKLLLAYGLDIDEKLAELLPNFSSLDESQTDEWIENFKSQYDNVGYWPS